jgi:hypothetical protein
MNSTTLRILGTLRRIKVAVGTSRRIPTIMVSTAHSTEYRKLEMNIGSLKILAYAWKLRTCNLAFKEKIKVATSGRKKYRTPTIIQNHDKILFPRFISATLRFSFEGGYTL